MEIYRLYETQQPILAFTADTGQDYLIPQGSRFIVRRSLHNVEPYPEDREFYEVAVGERILKVCPTEINGKATLVPI